MPSLGFRPPPGAHLNALTQRMPMSRGGLGGGMGSMRTPQGSPMSGGSGGFMGGMPSSAPPVANRAPSFQAPSAGNPLGTMGAGWHPGMLDGPSQNMFFALPQGLEEAFGFAPTGFTNSLQRGNKPGQLPPMGGGFMGGMF